MAKKHCNINPHAQPMQAALRAVDQFMRIGIADLPEPKARAKKQADLFQRPKRRSGQGPDNDRKQGKMRHRDQNGQHRVAVVWPRGGVGRDKPVEQAGQCCQVQNGQQNPDATQGRTCCKQARWRECRKSEKQKAGCHVSDC